MEHRFLEGKAQAFQQGRLHVYLTFLEMTRGIGIGAGHFHAILKAVAFDRFPDLIDACFLGQRANDAQPPLGLVRGDFRECIDQIVLTLSESDGGHVQDQF